MAHRCEICSRDFDGGEALEMHNRSKHREIVKGGLSSKQKRKVRNYAIVFFVLAVAAVSLYWKFVPAEDAPLLQLEVSDYNFGEVSQSKGVAIGEVSLTNVGKSDLVIKDLLSSCGCTSASLVVEGKEGPRFGMHNNPTGWFAVIPPGGKAKLKVYYNPNEHPELKGPVTRTVTIFSNTPRSPHKLTIHATQIP